MSITPKNCDVSVKKAIQQISRLIGIQGYPVHANLTLLDLTASSLVGTNADKLMESVTVGTGLDYTRPNLTLSHLGIEALTDPGADRIFFWDDNTTAAGWLAVGNSIAITTTTIDTIQDIRTGASPTFANLSLGTGELTAGSINRAAGTLTIEIAGTAEISISSTTVTLGGNLVIPDTGYIGSASDPNAIQIAASGEVTFTDVVTGVTPTAGNHFVTKEYADLLIGAFKTFFLSDTGSGVGSLNYAYPHETGEAQSSIVNDGGGEAYGTGTHLHQGYISEAGEPATTTIHAGIIAIHLHAKKGASNQRVTTLHAVISSVDADGSTGKTTIATSETTAELTDVETDYRIHAVIGSDVEVASTSRLICDVYANVTTGAQDSVVSLYMEGTEDSYFTTKVDSGIWQNQSDALDSITALGAIADNEFIVGTGAGTYAHESGATARTSIGLGTGNSPQFTGLTLTGTATIEGASVTVGEASTTTGTLVLHDSGSANTITLTVPNALAGSLSFTLPPTDGDNLEVLQTNGSGVLTWVAAGGASTFIALTDTPANYTSAAKKVAVVNEAANAIAFASNLYWNETDDRFGIGTATPDTLLHLKGATLELRFEENTAGDVVDFRCTTGGAFVIESNKDATAADIYIRPTMSGQSNVADLILCDEGGIVCVGSGSPAVSTKPFLVQESGVSSGSICALNTVASGVNGGAGGIFYSDDGAALASGDRLGFFLFGGSADASHNLAHSAGIVAYTTENWTLNSNWGTKIQFETVANGTVSRTTKLTINHDGGIFMYALKSGATQGAAGAATNELWKTVGHTSLPDNVIMKGA